MLPLVRGVIHSEVTRYEPDKRWEEDFWGAGMQGHLTYQFLPKEGGTLLIQTERLEMRGLLKLFSPLVKRMLYQRLVDRLEKIKALLEGGWQVDLER
jgi:hypothetical protein